MAIASLASSSNVLYIKCPLPCYGSYGRAIHLVHVIELQDTSTRSERYGKFVSTICFCATCNIVESVDWRQGRTPCVCGNPHSLTTRMPSAESAGFVQSSATVPGKGLCPDLPSMALYGKRERGWAFTSHTCTGRPAPSTSQVGATFCGPVSKTNLIGLSGK